MSKKDINTKVLPGFMELTPADQMAFEEIKNKIEAVFKQFGFVALDTPIIERSEILLAKAGGETEKQIFQFKKGDTDVALRFDLTVPLARYIAEHSRELNFPFRRYQIGKVFRGESSQKGRYREFYQCDIDIIGDDKLSLLNDAELPAVIYAIFADLGFGPFVIKISNRKLIIGLVEDLGLDDRAVEIMRIIDKLDKIGKEKVSELLKNLEISEIAIKKIFEFLEISGSNEYVLVALENLSITNKTFQTGLAELKEVISRIADFEVPESCYKIDLTIARGLDYYTGTVYETNLVEYPEIGSICSGGRYEDLAGKYSDQNFPGVGVSIGLTRLFSQLQDANLINQTSPTTAKVLVVPMTDDVSMALRVASTLRVNGIATQIYLEEAKKVAKKLDYANKIAVPFVILIGDDEITTGELSVKNMQTGEQEKVKVDEVVEYFEKVLVG